MAVFAAAFAPLVAFAQVDLQPAAIVKLTKTEPISVKVLKVEVAKLESKSGRALTAAERRQVLDVMINERLAVQAAERDKVVVSEAELNQQIQQARSSMAQTIGRQPTDAEFDSALKNETGTDLAGYKDQLRRQLVVQKYLLQKKKSTFEGIKEPTEAEIKDAYDLYKAKLVRPDSIRFSMLFVPISAENGGRDKAKEQIDRLEKDIGSSPGKFDEAIIRGQAQGSGYQGGDGGYLPKTSEAQKVVGSEFMSIAFSLKVGEVSRVMENQRGFQIIKVTEVYAQKTLELGDPYQLGSRGTVRDYLGNSMLQQRQQIAVDAATKELVEELRAGKSYQIFDANLNW